ncbi:MAG TPA: helix-turn-helix transcriptional regulator [Ohtaekwangia sp.]|uniref:helix-turn-helix domain-containing protein n=1 Tax=Ohtaekwangia sp. TaxID=2066019 RepID=UPI002F949448
MGKSIKRTSAKPKTDKELDVDLKKVGERMKQLRIKAGYTSYEIFAYENGISRSQYGRYEKGEDLRISSFLKVLNALGVTPKEFFSEGF